jgi:hypothetical protein
VEDQGSCKSAQDQYVGVWAWGVQLMQTSRKPIAHIFHELCTSDLMRLHDVRNRLSWIVLLPSKHQTLLHCICLYSNPYSNAGKLQHIITTHHGQQRAITRTGRTRKNTSGQCVSSSPFGKLYKLHDNDKEISHYSCQQSWQHNRRLTAIHYGLRWTKEPLFEHEMNAYGPPRTSQAKSVPWHQQGNR